MVEIKNHFIKVNNVITKNNKERKSVLKLFVFVQLQSILSEFNDLKAAVERHIAKMKCFASELEKSSQKLDAFGATATTNVIRYVSKVSTRSTTLPKDARTVSSGMKAQHSELTYIEPSTSSNRWSEQFDDIEVVITSCFVLFLFGLTVQMKRQTGFL